MRVCLSMIVKDEALTLPRCLASVRPWIDAWAIVDTGSTDGTQDIARRELVDLPGELVNKPWTDFATARNQALDLARSVGGDYALVIDADHRLVTGTAPPFAEMIADVVRVQCTFDGVMYYWREFLVRLDSPARWYRPIHETIVGDRTNGRIADGMMMFARNDGSRRRDPLWVTKEIAALEKIASDSPDDGYALFKLCGWYVTLGQLEKAAPIVLRLLHSKSDALVEATRLWLEGLEKTPMTKRIPSEDALRMALFNSHIERCKAHGALLQRQLAELQAEATKAQAAIGTLAKRYGLTDGHIVVTVEDGPHPLGSVLDQNGQPVQEDHPALALAAS